MRWKSPWVWLVAIWAVGIVSYSNTLSAPFVFDDLVEITRNPALQEFDIAELIERYPNRIVPYVTLAMNYRASGDSVVGYHVVNILIHLLTATTIFFLVSELTATTGARETKHLIAGITALLFVSHPIQTQAVTYIIQRLASLTALFYLLGLLLYVLARKSPSTSLKVKSWNWLHGAAWLVLLLAMFSKEIAFTAPMAILLIEWFFPTSLKLRGASFPRKEPDVRQGLSRQVFDSGWLSLGAARSRGEPTRPEQRIWQTLRSVFPYSLLLLVIPLTLWFQQPVAVERFGEASKALAPVERPLTAETTSLTRREYFLTQINVVRTYLRLLILPINQNLDYDYPISHSLFEARTLGSAFLLLSAIGFEAWLYPRNRLASFGISFFFLALLVESSFVPIRDVIYEHRLYLPSFGFFLAVAALVIQFLSKRVVLIGTLCLAVLLASATWARNNVWQSEITLWSDVVQKSPLKARGHNSLGVGYVKQNQEEKATEQFEQAIEIEPKYAEAYNNLGLMQAQQGEYDAAIELFKKAVELEPFYVHALNNMGVAYLKLGKPQAAIVPLEIAVGADDTYLDARINLAVAYLAMQQHDRAREQIEAVLQREPKNEGARQLLLLY